MFREFFFFITLYPPESESESEPEPGAGAGVGAAEIEEPGAAKNGRLRNTGLIKGYTSLELIYNFL
jgi:hypothetical protein